MNRPKIQFRPLDGLLLLDKPGGMSSNGALQCARRLLRADKGGHTGSLDPLATGLLPLCFGDATKIAGLLLGSDKAYRAGVRLGVRTDSDDADGAVVETRPVPVLERATIEAALAPLHGRILQRPPVYSALKRDGEALYAKARRGETVEVEPREVDVQRIALIEHGGIDLVLEIECGTGTYVRSLVRDLGEALGCGAHVTSLRRLWVTPFREPAMVTLDALQAMDEAQREACLLPVEAGLAGWPRLLLDAAQARRLGQGQRFAVDAPTGRYLAATAEAGPALGLVEVDAEGLVRVQRLFRHAAV